MAQAVGIRPESAPTEFDSNWIDWKFPKWDSKDGTWQQAVKDALDDISDVLFTSQQYFDDNFTAYFDRDNLTDYLLFAEIIHDYDGLSHGIQFISYDMKKVFLQPRDKDSTFGANSQANSVLLSTANLININTFNE